ncbi:MAG: hypothetical protein U1E51_26160 [Candidatus Binatia bacterium]|nr:hypothetical protein [Candidatus Binatia bacterium]
MKRLIQVLDPLNGTTGLTCDAKGNLLNVTDARSNATKYAYVSMDGLATRVAAKPQQKRKRAFATETRIARTV